VLLSMGSDVPIIRGIAHLFPTKSAEYDKKGDDYVGWQPP
jgi:hypothetical protein